MKPENRLAPRARAVAAAVAVVVLFPATACLTEPAPCAPHCGEQAPELAPPEAPAPRVDRDLLRTPGRALDAWALDGVDERSRLAFDGAGNLYLAGYYYGEQPLLGVGAAQADVAGYVARYAPSGELAWATALPLEGITQHVSEVAAAVGAVYVGGTYRPLGGAVIGLPFVARLDADSGEIEWLNRLGGSGDGALGSIRCMTVAGDGRLFAAVGFEPGYRDDGRVQTPSADHAGPFVALYGGDGQVDWSWDEPHFECQGASDGTLALLDYDADVYSVRRLAADGSEIDSFVLPRPAAAELHRIAISAADERVLLVGWHTDAVAFGVSAATQVGEPTPEDDGIGRDLVVVAVEGGSPRWARSYGGAGREYGSSVAATADGFVLVGTIDRGGIDLGGGELPLFGGEDLWIARFAPDGAHRWSRSLGAEGDEHYLPSVAAAIDGRSALAGGASGPLDPGNGLLEVGGAYDTSPFVAIYAR